MWFFATVEPRSLTSGRIPWESELRLKECVGINQVMCVCLLCLHAWVCAYVRVCLSVTLWCVCVSGFLCVCVHTYICICICMCMHVFGRGEAGRIDHHCWFLYYPFKVLTTPNACLSKTSLLLCSRKTSVAKKWANMAALHFLVDAYGWSSIHLSIATHITSMHVAPHWPYKLVNYI